MILIDEGEQKEERERARARGRKHHEKKTLALPILELICTHWKHHCSVQQGPRTDQCCCCRANNSLVGGKQRRNTQTTTREQEQRRTGEQLWMQRQKRLREWDSREAGHCNGNTQRGDKGDYTREATRHPLGQKTDGKKEEHGEERDRKEMDGVADKSSSNTARQERGAGRSGINESERMWDAVRPRDPQSTVQGRRGSKRTGDTGSDDKHARGLSKSPTRKKLSKITKTKFRVSASAPDQQFSVKKQKLLV